jgi:hypothetical protein
MPEALLRSPQLQIIIAKGIRSDLETKICRPFSRLSLAASLVKHKALGTSPSWKTPSLLSLLSEYLALDSVGLW